MAGGPRSNPFFRDVEIDGDLSEWSIQHPQAATDRFTEDAWTGPADGTVAFGLRFDGEGLVFGAIVHDDVLANDPDTWAWDQDSIEACIDARPEPRSTNTGKNEGRDFYFGVAPQTDGQDRLVHQEDRLPAVASRQRLSHGYGVELSVPVAWLNSAMATAARSVSMSP